jgi:hypothetical protein
MPKIRSSRIEIKPEVWPALQVEAIIREMSPKDLVNQLIVNCLSQKAREFLRAKPYDPIIPRSNDTKNEIVAEAIITQEPKDQMAQEPTIPKARRKRLAKNPEVTARITEMWNREPRPSTGDIARELEFPYSSVQQHIKRLIEDGRLSPR